METITAQELINRLSELPEDALVAFSSDYGDHCHTEQIHFIKGRIEEKKSRKSAYSYSGYAIADVDDYDDEDPDEAENESNTIWIIQ